MGGSGFSVLSVQSVVKEDWERIGEEFFHHGDTEAQRLGNSERRKR